MLLELVRSSAERDPDRLIVRSDAGGVTAADLLESAEAVAANLSSSGLGRVGCLIDDVGHVLALICGAAAAGVEVCVYPPDLDDAAVDQLAASLGHTAVVSDTGRSSQETAVIPFSELVRPAPGARSNVHTDPAVLILTTGTTGTPKAARHLWRRLISGVGAGAPGATWLLVYNVNQFAGIQVLLHALVNEATIVVPTSRRARDAVAAIRAHRVTHVSGTPTFWRLLVGEVGRSPLEPATIQQITIGGEVVPGELLDRLREAFPAARITHIYAGTEFGSAIAVSDGRPGLPASLLTRAADGRVQVRVVDGELHLRSTVGMVGYLDGEDVSDQWIATGDLVDMHDDRLMFTGRVVERINVGGTKVSPYLVEQVVHGVRGVSVAAAYGKSNPITGSIVAVDVVAAADADRGVVKRDIQAACETLPPPARPRLIRFVDELAQRGGKVTRPMAPEPHEDRTA